MPSGILDHDLDILDDNIKPDKLHCAPEMEVCRVHLQLVKVLRDLVQDIKWMIQIGKWVSLVVGTASLILVGFIIHAWDISNKLSAIEARQVIVMSELNIMKDDFKKHLVTTVDNLKDNK